MGQSIIGRPIGPSYVPGTSQGQSSATAPVSQMTTPQPVPPQMPGPAQQVPNPAQDPRNKFWKGAAQAAPDKVPQISGAIKAASAIGTAQNTGLRRYTMDSKNG